MGCNSPGATHHLACDCREQEWSERLAASEKAREAWTEAARMHAKNEAYYRDLIVRTLSGTPAAFVSDDGSVQQDVICAKLPELYAASEKAREEAERRFAVISPAGHAIDYAAWVAAMDQIERHRLDFTNCADVGRRMEVRALAAESRAERLEAALERIAVSHTGCDDRPQPSARERAELESDPWSGYQEPFCGACPRCIARAALGEEGE